MKPLEPHELSGLLDGQLDAQRAAEVQREIDANPELRNEWEQLRRMDHVWASAAAQASFKPKVAMLTARRRAVPVVVGLAIGIPVLVVARCVAEWVPAFAWTVAIQALVLAVLVAGLIRMIGGMSTPPAVRGH